MVETLQANKTSAGAYVGMGELKVGRDRDAELLCVGLGSCIAVCMYDAARAVGALAHVVLPVAPDGNANPAKYADTAIPLMLRTLREFGSRPGDLRVALVGGAAIFSSVNSHMDIGQRNGDAVKAALQQAGLRVQKEDIGGRESRSTSLSMIDGAVRVRTVRLGNTLLTVLGKDGR